MQRMKAGSHLPLKTNSSYYSILKHQIQIKTTKYTVTKTVDDHYLTHQVQRNTRTAHAQQWLGSYHNQIKATPIETDPNKRRHQDRPKENT